jgi:hypothetical protein
MTVPYTFGTATTSIPLSNLDANFNTPITLGNTSIYLGNTTTTIGNLTLTNATISSGTVNITNVTVTTANVTNITVTGTANIATGNVTTLTSTSITDSGLTSGRVTYAGASGLLSDSANLVWDNTNARLGIGTASPSYILDIQKTASAQLRLFSTNNSTGSQLILGSGTGTGTTSQYIYFDNSLILSQASVTDRVTINSSGNVGLGTASPTGRLDVVYDNALVGRFYSSAGRGIVRVDGLTDSSFQAYKNGSLVGFFQTDSGGTEIVTGTSGAFPYSIYTNNTEKVRVTSAGNVGIGTSSPSYPLSVQTSTTANSRVTGNFYNTGATSTTPFDNWVCRLASNGSGADCSINFTDSVTYNAYIGMNSGKLIFGANTTTPQMTLDATGNVGLGVTPNTWFSTNYKTLQIGTGSLFSQTNGSDIRLSSNAYLSTAPAWTYINGTADFATSYEQTGGEHRFFNAPSGTGAISFTQAMTLDASGNLLVGTTAGINANSIFKNSTGLDVYRTTSTAGNAIQYWYSDNTATASLRAYIAANGGFYNYQGNDGNLSDARLKTDIVNATNYLEKICAIPVHTFKYKNQSDDSTTLGVIAQEVELIAPELVGNDGFGELPEDGIPLKVIYQTDLQYALMKCIQEQQALIESLTNRLTALESK